MSLEETRPTDFIRAAVAEDLRAGRFKYVRTRLPPEPNGYLHIGHVKAFMIDYLAARENGGELILRFDDTNPVKEETEYVQAIEDDARWLGIQWVKVTYASDYFDLLYEWAVKLVNKGLAYVDDQNADWLALIHTNTSTGVNGSSKVNVAPRPVPSLCARSVPPNSLAAIAELCRPKPWPSFLVVNPYSHSRGKCSGKTPTPLSHTSTRSVSSKSVR
jgi:hypothetical protein